MLEQAVLLCRDMEQFDKIGGYAERGALLYRQGNLNYLRDKFTMLTISKNKTRTNFRWKPRVSCPIA